MACILCLCIGFRQLHRALHKRSKSLRVHALFRKEDPLPILFAEVPAQYQRGNEMSDTVILCVKKHFFLHNDYRTMQAKRPVNEHRIHCCKK
jgi:hypothetical protein